MPLQDVHRPEHGPAALQHRAVQKCARTKLSRNEWLMGSIRELHDKLHTRQEAVVAFSKLFSRGKRETARVQAKKDRPGMLKAKQKLRMKRR